MTTESWLVPDWPAPPWVHALSTTRQGGLSHPPYDSLNLAQHVADQHEAVVQNRAILQHHAGYAVEPAWLEQVHGDRVVEALAGGTPQKADASFTTTAQQVCVVLTADCLPVLFCDKQGRGVAAAHAGWRGLSAGVLEATAQTLCSALVCSSSELLVWLGPAIGPTAFEVGDEVRDAFLNNHDVANAFRASRAGHWLMDIYAVARFRLRALGIEAISGGEHCTVNEPEKFFSYRRDGRCGRMASLIWLAE